MHSISNPADTLRLDIVPEAGASIANFNRRMGDTWVSLMRPTTAEDVASLNVSMMASFNLVPWSNRVVGSAFTFQGQRYELRPNTPQGFAIHGDARERPWTVTEANSEYVACSFDSRDFPGFNYPFPFTASIQYLLGQDTFDTVLTLTNLHTDAIPAGFGFHPYFLRSLSASQKDDVLIQFCARGVYPPLPGMQTATVSAPVIPELNPLCEIPEDMNFTTLTQIGSRDIDHCYGGWDGKASIIYPSSGLRLDLECSEALRHVILYSPPGRDFFALEPVTHANDAFNLHEAGASGTGLRVLQPGEQLMGLFRIKVSSS